MSTLLTSSQADLGFIIECRIELYTILGFSKFSAMGSKMKAPLCVGFDCFLKLWFRQWYYLVCRKYIYSTEIVAERVCIDEETINEVNGLSSAIIGVYFYVLHFVKDDSLSLKVCV